MDYTPSPSPRGNICRIMAIGDEGAEEIFEFQRPIGTTLEGLIWSADVRSLCHAHHADIGLTLLRTGGLW